MERRNRLRTPPRASAHSLGQEVLPGPLTSSSSLERQILAGPVRAASLSRHPDRQHQPALAARPQVSTEEYATLLADSVGLALLVVLDTLAPAERLAFVLHDMFAVPFDEIAPILDRSPNAAAQIASRARRRVQDAATPDVDLTRQREVVGAFLAAARDGDFDGLLAVLDPDVVLRADAGAQAVGASKVVRGARAVVEQALTFSRLAWSSRPALVNGTVGLVTVRHGHPAAVMGFTLTVLPTAEAGGFQPALDWLES